jgi:signal transduction histidine kinase
MRKLLIPLILFIALLLASLTVLTLWIVWAAIDATHVMWLLQGIFLMAAVISAGTIIFFYYTKMRSLDIERVNFISSVSHELLTPLASVRLYIDTMLLRELTAEQRRDFLTLMLGDAERLSTLIARILMAARIERHRTRYNYEQIDLAAFVKNFIAERRSLFGGAHIELAIPERECWAHADPEALAMVLMNLVQNGVRYSPTPASIAIALEEQKGKWLLTVSDKGDGIAAADLKKIFRLFYRASHRQAGTGLGLYIVENIVTDHRGKVWAESAGIGQGAAFKVMLPCKAQAEG